MFALGGFLSNSQVPENRRHIVVEPGRVLVPDGSNFLDDRISPGFPHGRSPEARSACRSPAGRTRRPGTRSRFRPAWRPRGEIADHRRFDICGWLHRPVVAERGATRKRVSVPARSAAPAFTRLPPRFPVVTPAVMAGLVPAIHVLLHRGASREGTNRRPDVDARNKSIAVRFNSGTGPVPMGETISTPLLSPRTPFRGPGYQAPL